MRHYFYFFSLSLSAFLFCLRSTRAAAAPAPAAVSVIFVANVCRQINENLLKDEVEAPAGQDTASRSASVLAGFCVFIEATYRLYTVKLTLGLRGQSNVAAFRLHPGVYAMKT